MRYIDIVRSVVRNAQEKDIPALTWDEQKHHINAIRQKIDDIEIVVRCKDCCHRVHDEERNLYYCEMYYGQGDVSDKNFCQWGERREP